MQVVLLQTELDINMIQYVPWCMHYIILIYSGHTMMYHTVYNASIFLLFSFAVSEARSFSDAGLGELV